MHLCDLRTGEVLATASRMNPQVAYGEDLMSRVSYCDDRPDGLATLHDAIIAALNELAAEAAAEAGITTDAITDIVLVGNTVMHHILLNIPPRELGQSPFGPAISDAVDIKARDLGLKLAPGAQAHVLPVEAGHVGADNVGVILAEEPDKAPADEVWLIVDVGTNGEILLGNRDQLFSASSPTGPAFEGAQIRHGMRAAPGAIERVRVDPETLDVRIKVIGRDAWNDEWDAETTDDTETRRAGEPRRGDVLRNDGSASARQLLGQGPILAAGICGSGIIEAVAELFMAGVLTPDGRFAPEIELPRLSWQGAKAEFVLAWPHETSTGRPIVITSDDVRNIQLGKAALYSGARLLMERMGVEQVDRVLLAGAFGSYIDPRARHGARHDPRLRPGQGDHGGQFGRRRRAHRPAEQGRAGGRAAAGALDQLHRHRDGAALPGCVRRSDPAAARRGRLPASGRGAGDRLLRCAARGGVSDAVRAPNRRRQPPVES